MRFVLTPTIGRRRLVLTGAAAAAAAAAPLLGCRAGAEGVAALPATPAQTRGPFYPTAFPPDADNDLVVLRGAEARAEGVVAHIAGRVLTADGRPLPGARVEIWQCDARGVYLHSGDGRHGVRDTAFQGFGRAVAGADGGYTAYLPDASGTPVLVRRDDGIHLTPAGASRLAAQLLDTLRSDWPLL